MSIADKELKKLHSYAKRLNEQGLSKEQITAKLKNYVMNLDDKKHALIAIATSKQEAQK